MTESITSEDLKEIISANFERKYVFLTGSATTAIFLALKGLKIKKKGNVFLPDTLCPDPANAVIYSGLKPIFCDVNLNDYNMNADSLNEAITKNTREIIPIHLFGQPAEMQRIEEIAEDRDLAIIEDAAQAAGGRYKGKKPGHLEIYLFLALAANNKR
jgi:dTDP-4-amino-4,6-dideoxygalactose transaminase